MLSGRFGEPELRFVALHELAHHRRDHLWKGVAWFALFAFPCAFVLGWAGERRGGRARPGGGPPGLRAPLFPPPVSPPVRRGGAPRLPAGGRPAGLGGARRTPPPRAALPAPP